MRYWKQRNKKRRRKEMKIEKRYITEYENELLKINILNLEMKKLNK